MIIKKHPGIIEERRTMMRKKLTSLFPNKFVAIYIKKIRSNFLFWF